MKSLPVQLVSIAQPPQYVVPCEERASILLVASL